MDNPSLIDALNLKDLPEAEQEEMLNTIADAVFRGSLVRLIEQMDESTKDEFLKLLETDQTGDEVDTFLRERVPQTDQVVRETLADLTSDLVSLDIPK